jgi:hypothetical protein
MPIAAAQAVSRIAELLAAGPTAAGSAVYTGRTASLQEGQLPAWVLYAEGETIQTEGLEWPAVQEHELRVTASGLVALSTDLEAELHALSEQGITALFATPEAARLAPLPECDMRLLGIDRSLSTLGPLEVGQVTLAIGVRYRTAANAPGTLI